MFDNAPSMHKEGILELIAKSNDLLIFHCASQRDKRHPSEVFTSKDIFSKSRFRLNSSIRNNTVVDVTTIDNENKDINLKEQIDKTINDYINQYQDENTKFTIEDHVELESDSED